MRLVCPECGALASATAWANDASVRQFLKIALELPWAISSRALPYIALFRPSVKRGLAWDKSLRLIGELAELSRETHIQWDGKPARPVFAEIWGQALEAIIQRPPRKLPLASHGYLKSIAYDLADESDRRREVQHNQAESNGALSADLAAERAEKPASPEAVSAMMEKWRSRRRS
jgi:hypothetical protein